MKFLIFLSICIALPALVYYQDHKAKTMDDKKHITQLEHSWLNSLHNKTALDSILASDFVHPVPGGVFLTKNQHIGWAASHPSPEDYHYNFDTLSVRVYGNAAIANGIVAVDDNHGKLIRRSIFTDVFIKRNGKWQAVNAQENLVK